MVYYDVLKHIITIEEAQNSSQYMNDNTMVDLVQRITHVHLKQTKIRNKPKCVEEKVESTSLMLPIIVTSIRALGVLSAIRAELYNRPACPWNSSCCSLNSFFDPGSRLGLENLVCFQERFYWTVTTMTTTCSLICIITHYGML